jgi:hypothetical protein
MWKVSASDLFSVVVPFPVPTCRSFGSGSGSRQYLAKFSNKQKMAQSLAFSMSEAVYFPESWPLIFDFLNFLLSLLDPDPNPVPKTET